MTIVHLSSSLGIGGAAMMILEMSKLSMKKSRTIVFSISENNSLEHRFKDENIEYYFLNINSFRNKSLSNGLKALHQKLNDIDDEIIFHCHQFHGFVLGFLYNLIFKKHPIIFTLHSTDIKDMKRKLLLYVTKRFRKFDIIFSRNTKQWYLKNNIVIPNGVDFGKLEGVAKRSYTKSDKFSFLFLGRLSKEKNPLFMISAALQLKGKQVNNFIFDVVGDGNQMKELKESINKHNLSKHFNLYGFQRNIPEYLIKSHCLILPSLREGMPVVLIEAAATKLPVIATPVGSIPEILNTSNGYISKLGDFVENMISVMMNYNDALDKSEKLYLKTKKIFDIKAVYENHLSLYKSLIK